MPRVQVRAQEDPAPSLLITELIKIGYRVDLRPFQRPISLIELAYLRGEIEADPEAEKEKVES